ncbi:MAG: VWA domain-containing protein [Gemmatimonadaceae bacterium]
MSRQVRVIVTLCLWLVGASATCVTAQEPTFRAVTERVRLDALITENGRLLAGLTADDLEVVDNGVKQTVDIVSFDQLPVNVVCVLDMSESVSGPTITALRGAIDGVASGLRSGDQSALLTFNHRVALASPLSSDVGGVREAAATLVPGGGTALIDALYASLSVAEADSGRAVIIVFSDGLDTASWLSAEHVVEAAKRVDAVIYAVNTRTGRRDQLLSTLTETTGGRVFDVASPGRLATTFTSILEEFRQRHIVSYVPTGVHTAGWHKVELRVRGKRAAVKMRAGYLQGRDWRACPRLTHSSSQTGAHAA